MRRRRPAVSEWGRVGLAPAAPTGSRHTVASRLGWVALGLVVGIVATVAVTIAVTWPSSSTLLHARQPAAVRYPDHRQHYVEVVRSRSTWDALRGEDNTYSVTAGSDPSLSADIHIVTFSATGTDSPRVRVRWRRDGIHVRFPSGHTVYIPAREFLYGR